MNPKTYLQQVRKYDTLINNKLAEITSLRELTTSITSSLKTDIVQSSGAPDRIAKCIERIVDLEREVNADIDCFITLKREIMSTIDQIDDLVSVDLLYKRYFQYKTWEVIAIEMGYSYRQITRLHGKALKMVNDVL